MADVFKKTIGSRLMNGFPLIAFVIVIAVAVVVWLEIL